MEPRPRAGVHDSMESHAQASALPASLSARSLPGPSSTLLSTLGFLRDPLGILDRMAARYGDPFRVPSYTGPMVLTANLEGVRAIFSADSDLYGSMAAGGLLEPVIGTKGV